MRLMAGCDVALIAALFEGMDYANNIVFHEKQVRRSQETSLNAFPLTALSCGKRPPEDLARTEA